MSAPAPASYRLVEPKTIKKRAPDFWGEFLFVFFSVLGLFFFFFGCFRAVLGLFWVFFGLFGVFWGLLGGPRCFFYRFWLQ